MNERASEGERERAQERTRCDHVGQFLRKINHTKPNEEQKPHNNPMMKLDEYNKQTKTPIIHLIFATISRNFAIIFIYNFRFCLKFH